MLFCIMKCCQNVARVPQEFGVVLCGTIYCQKITYTKPEAKYLTLLPRDVSPNYRIGDSR